MHRILRQLAEGLMLTGHVERDVAAFLTHHRCQETAIHCARVSGAAGRLAVQFGADPAQAKLGGMLHDVSAVIPAADRADIARTLGLQLLPEEQRFPTIIHQKLSVVLAQELFGVTDTAILSAVGCHTTLKQHASPLDKLVFVADKVEWDQPGGPPYLPQLQTALAESLDAGALAYLQWMWEERSRLKVVHPWLRAAYEELAGRPW